MRRHHSPQQETQPPFLLLLLQDLLLSVTPVVYFPETIPFVTALRDNELGFGDGDVAVDVGMILLPASYCPEKGVADTSCFMKKYKGLKPHASYFPHWPFLCWNLLHCGDLLSTTSWHEHKCVAEEDLDVTVS